jgi:hypothetical protein
MVMGSAGLHRPFRRGLDANGANPSKLEFILFLCNNLSFCSPYVNNILLYISRIIEKHMYRATHHAPIQTDKGGKTVDFVFVTRPKRPK